MQERMTAWVLQRGSKEIHMSEWLYCRNPQHEKKMTMQRSGGEGVWHKEQQVCSLLGRTHWNKKVSMPGEERERGKAQERESAVSL